MMALLPRVEAAVQAVQRICACAVLVSEKDVCSTQEKGSTRGRGDGEGKREGERWRHYVGELGPYTGTYSTYVPFLSSGGGRCRCDGTKEGARWR